MQKGTFTIGGAFGTSTGGIIASGPGTLVLSGANLYTGTTGVSNGNLTLTGSVNGGTGSVLGGVTGSGLNVFTYAPSGTGAATQTFTTTNMPGLQNLIVLSQGSTSTAILNIPSITNPGFENDYVILGGVSSSPPKFRWAHWQPRPFSTPCGILWHVAQFHRLKFCGL